MKRVLFLMITMAVFAFSSCTKSVESLSENDDMAIKDAFLEQISSESDGILTEIIAFNTASAVATKAMWGERFLTGSVVITIRDSSSIRIITVDFGTIGNVGVDGKSRKGKLVAYITKTQSTNTEQKLKFLDYSVDGYLHNGQVIRNITRQIDSNSQQAVISENFKVVFPDGVKSNQRVSNMTRLYKFGVAGTQGDNYIHTFGTITLTNEKGVSQTKVIPEANKLIFKVDPGEIIKGIATTTFSDGKKRIIDYGDGTLDNKATVSDGTKTWTIKLKK
jgi:hypothetical protein